MPDLDDGNWIVLERFVTHVKRQALGDGDIGEPANVNASGITFAIIPRSGQVPEVTLSTRRERHRTTIRFYCPVNKEDPGREAERQLDRLRQAILRDVFGDFELGAADVYAEPAETAWDYGYQTVGVTFCRILDVNVTYTFWPDELLAPEKDLAI